MKKKLLFNLLLIFLVCLVSTTSAYLILKRSTTNSFSLGSISPEVIETFNAQTKKDVYIKNNSNVPVYVRVAIIINLVDNNGNTLGIRPVENVDYLKTMNSSSNWLKSNDGYYYYQKPLNPSETTDILIKEIKEANNLVENKLNVDIVTEAVQANPPKAVSEAWNVQVVDGQIVLGA